MPSWMFQITCFRAVQDMTKATVQLILLGKQLALLALSQKASTKLERNRPKVFQLGESNKNLQGLSCVLNSLLGCTSP